MLVLKQCGKTALKCRCVCVLEKEGERRREVRYNSKDIHKV